MLITLLQLIWVFFYIGLFGFGGGYAMISLIQFEVVNNHAWMTAGEFANLLALSQMTPGPISINTATYVGFTVFQSSGYGFAILGAVVATVALCLPSLLMMGFVIKLLFRNENNRYVQAVFSGLRPAVAGLIFSTGALMMFNFDAVHNFVMNASDSFSFEWKTENFGDGIAEHIISALICIVSFVALFFYKANPMKLIVIAGIVGFVCYYLLGMDWFYAQNW